MSTGISPEENKAQLAQFIRDIRPLVEELRASWDEHPNVARLDPHPLSRPGLHASMDDSRESIKFMDMRVPGLPTLSLDTTSGLYLSTYVKVPAGGSSRSLMLAGLGQQSDATLANWRVDFAHARQVLATINDAIATGQPLDGRASWAESLRMHLEQEDPKSFNTRSWAHWITMWGTPDMQATMDVANGLCDSDKHFQEWRALVVAGWASLEQDGPSAPSSISPSLFE